MTLEFGKDKTAIIKGVAILLMIVHHCGITGYWDTPPEILCNDMISHFSESMKLCVGIFTFMVGYGYAFSKTKDMRYSLSHIGRLLLPFWVILGVFTIPVWVYLSHGAPVDWGLLAMNAVGVNSKLNWFSWFVAFYIFAMGTMPIMSRLIDKAPMLWTPALILLAFTCEVALHELYPGYTENDWTQRLFDCLFQTPCMLLGYLFATRGWFSNVSIPRSPATPVLAFLLFAGCLLLRSIKASLFGFNLDFFYAPCAIFAILLFFNSVRFSPLNRILSALGMASVYMWFFHALFFNQVTRAVYQPLVAISDSFIIITLWTIVLTYVCSLCTMRIVDKASVALKKLSI